MKPKNVAPREGHGHVVIPVWENQHAKLYKSSNLQSIRNDCMSQPALGEPQVAVLNRSLVGNKRILGRHSWSRQYTLTPICSKFAGSRLAQIGIEKHRSQRGRRAVQRFFKRRLEEFVAPIRCVWPPSGLEKLSAATETFEETIDRHRFKTTNHSVGYPLRDSIVKPSIRLKRDTFLRHNRHSDFL